MGGSIDLFVFLNLFFDFLVRVFFKSLLLRIFGALDAPHRPKEFSARHRVIRVRQRTAQHFFFSNDDDNAMKNSRRRRFRRWPRVE